MKEYAVGRWRAGGGLQVLSGPWLMLGICSLIVPVLMYDSEMMLWKVKERSRVRAVQMDNLRGLLGIKRMDKVLNAWIRELRRVRKDLDERIDEGILQWFGHMERDRIADGVYERECAGNLLIGRPRKR